MKQQTIIVLGGGRFGGRAIEFLQHGLQPAHMMVVDTRQETLKKAEMAGCEAVAMDAISFLIFNEEKMVSDDWIVPAIPVHVAYEWVRRKMKKSFLFEAMPVPEDVENLLPNPIRGPAGQLYASNATFICPDDCPEPEERCTVTGKPRPQVLCDTLSSLVLSGFRSVCIVSSQLAPGVGGFQLETFRRAVAEVIKKPGKILFSTSCKCHGVIHAFNWKPKS